MNIEREQVFLLVEDEIFKKEGNKILESVKQVERLLARINRIGNRIQNEWKGENGTLCYERLYEILQLTEQAREQIEEYAKEVQQFVK